MAYIHQEEIIGYYVQGQVVCSDCVTDEERQSKFTAKGIITKEDITERGLLFLRPMW